MLTCQSKDQTESSPFHCKHICSILVQWGLDWEKHLFLPYTGGESGLLEKSSRTVKPRPTAWWEPSLFLEMDTNSKTTRIPGTSSDVWKYRTWMKRTWKRLSGQQNNFRLSEHYQISSNIYVTSDQGCVRTLKACVWIYHLCEFTISLS